MSDQKEAYPDFYTQFVKSVLRVYEKTEAPPRVCGMALLAEDGNVNKAIDSVKWIQRAIELHESTKDELKKSIYIMRMNIPVESSLDAGCHTHDTVIALAHSKDEAYQFLVKANPEIKIPAYEHVRFDVRPLDELGLIYESQYDDEF